MQIILKNSDNNQMVKVTLDDERRSLANFLAFLDTNQIDEMEVIDCKDAKMPRNLQYFASLHTLRFVRCHSMTGVAPELGRLPMLKKLGWVKCADFYDLRGIETCSSLEVLQVSGCDAFDTLPDGIANLSHLRALDLSYCESLGWVDLRLLPQSLRLLDMHGCWQGDFDPDVAMQMRLISLQIQDVSKEIDWDGESSIDDICTQLRHSMALRNGYALDN